MKIPAESLIQSSSPVNNVIASAVESPAQQALRAMPEVDIDRVNAMQAAIRNGELLLDSSSLAGSMIDYYHR